MIFSVKSLARKLGFLSLFLLIAIASKVSAEDSGSLNKREIQLVQIVLNTFGFNVGKADGIAGRKTLSGLENFYLERGWIYDGTLSKNEFNFFVKFLWRKERLKSPRSAPLIISDFQSPFGVKGRRRPANHQGIDITGPIGQPILAVADGKVLETTVEKCWGPTIVVDHGRALDGRKLIALYGHLGDMLVSEGDKVQRGQLIARLGNNQANFRCIGGVRHLHFQLGQKYRKKGEKGAAWGHTFFLYDGGKGINPHQLWADGPNWVTCFDPSKSYRKGTLTYPVPCNK